MARKRLLMGYWDCKYCDTKKILGTERVCPNCGRPRGKDTKFYLDGEHVELTAEQAKTKNKGADWLCPYCDTLNSALNEVCESCGSPKTDSKKDYFNMNEKPDDSAEEEYNHDSENNKQEASSNLNSERLQNLFPEKLTKFTGKILPILLAVILLSGLIWLFIPKNQELTIVNKSWQYTQKIESYETFRESDWSLPANARLVDKKSEIHHYDQEFDHYETRTRQVSESVLDGYDESCSYSDNGDGSFSETCVDVPRYRTEYHTEEYQEAVYKDVPVYQTKYYYDIDKWVYKRSVISSGTTNEPYWEEYILADNERAGEKVTEYWIEGYIKKPNKTKKYEVNEKVWRGVRIGETYSVKISVLGLTEIKI